MEYFRAASISVTLSIGIFYIFGNWLWKYVWKIIPQLNTWYFPNLNGRWTGNVNSNWPLVRKILPEHASSGEDTLSEHPITIDIKQTLFSIHLIMNADDEYSSSKTLVVIPEKNKETGEITLYELYESKVLTPKNTDHSRYFGAGVLNYRNDGSKDIIEGHYWTDREWRKGLNTAGSLQVIRKTH